MTAQNSTSEKKAGRVKHSAMASVLVRRIEDRGLANRFRTYLAAPRLRQLEMGITDPAIAALKIVSVQDACLLAGSHRRLAQKDGQNVGATLRLLVSKRELSENSAETRLLSLSRQTWPAAVTTLRSILGQAESASAGFDWNDLAWVAQNWATGTHHQDISRWARGYHDPPPDQSESAVSTSAESETAEITSPTNSATSATGEATQ